jgi:hypothetical protein
VDEVRDVVRVHRDGLLDVELDSQAGVHGGGDVGQLLVPEQGQRPGRADHRADLADVVAGPAAFGRSLVAPHHEVDHPLDGRLGERRIDLDPHQVHLTHPAESDPARCVARSPPEAARSGECARRRERSEADVGRRWRSC